VILPRMRFALADARVSYRWGRDSASRGRLGHAVVRFLLALFLPRYVNDRTRAQRGRVRHLYGLLEPLILSRGEQLSLLRFTLRVFLVSTFSRTPRDRDVRLQLNGAQYIVGLLTTEPYTLAEIYLERQHDHRAEFIPRDGWVVLDVGANVGMYAVLQARRGATVFAFEPNLDCCRRLDATVKANQLLNHVTICNYALGATAGRGTISLDEGPGVTTSGRIVASGASPVPANFVRVESLDRVIPQLHITRVDLLKVDVEGDEVLVLEGARATLNIVKRVIVECHSASLEQRTAKILREHGFIEAGHVNVAASRDVRLLYAHRDLERDAPSST
jgi:FkbM family methyltransferase